MGVTTVSLPFSRTLRVKRGKRCCGGSRLQTANWQVGPESLDQITRKEEETFGSSFLNVKPRRTCTLLGCFSWESRSEPAGPLCRAALFCRPQLLFRAIRLCPLFRSIIQHGNSALRRRIRWPQDGTTLLLQTGLIKPCHLETIDSHLHGHRAEYESCAHV